PPLPTPFPYTTLFRSGPGIRGRVVVVVLTLRAEREGARPDGQDERDRGRGGREPHRLGADVQGEAPRRGEHQRDHRDDDGEADTDRKSTRLNSSHVKI